MNHEAKCKLESYAATKANQMGKICGKTGNESIIPDIEQRNQRHSTKIDRNLCEIFISPS